MKKLTPVEVIRNYEAVILMSVNATEQEQKDLFKNNSKIIGQYKGEVHHLDIWGSRKLANTIDKNMRAIFFHTTFTAKAEAIEELERTMRINDKVLRYMHTRLDERVPLSKHLEGYRKIIEESNVRENEREVKFQKKKQMRSDRPERSERSESRY